MTIRLRALPFITPMHRGRLPACSCRHDHVDGLHISVHDPGCLRVGDMMVDGVIRWGDAVRPLCLRLGVRAHPTATTNHAHAPPPPPQRVEAEDVHR